MANTLMDARYEYLQNAGYSGHVNDMLLAWLQSHEGVYSAALPDAWKEMLESRGFLGHRNDAWYEMLGAMGFIGAHNDREFQFWNSGFPLPLPGMMMRFVPDYNPGDFVIKGDTVNDMGWLMVAQTNTTAPAAPQRAGDPTSCLPDDPTFTISSYTGLVISGAVYTITKAGWLREIEADPAATGASIRHRVVVADITDGSTESAQVAGNLQLVANEWTPVAISAKLLLPGTRVMVLLESLNSGSSTQWQHVWDYAGTSNTDGPAASGWNRRTQQDIIRVHYTDKDGQQRDTELGTVIPGSTITCSNTSDLNQYWRYAVNSGTDMGSYYEFNVTLIGTGGAGGVPEGAETLIDVDIPVPLATEYQQWAGYYGGNQPDWATVEGYLQRDGVEQAVPNDAFGVRMSFQPAIVSEDWKVASTMEVSGPGVTVSMDQLDRLREWVKRMLPYRPQGLFNLLASEGWEVLLDDEQFTAIVDETAHMWTWEDAISNNLSHLPLPLNADIDDYFQR